MTRDLEPLNVTKYLAKHPCSCQRAHNWAKVFQKHLYLMIVRTKVQCCRSSQHHKLSWHKQPWERPKDGTIDQPASQPIAECTYTDLIKSTEVLLRIHVGQFFFCLCTYQTVILENTPKQFTHFLWLGRPFRWTRHALGIMAPENFRETWVQAVKYLAKFITSVKSTFIYTAVPHCTKEQTEFS